MTKPATLLLVLALTLPAAAQTPIRVWGHGHRGQDYILTLLQAWEGAFQRTHPATTFDNQLHGNASGLAGLYTDTADLALLDREASFIEVDAYQQGTGYDPFRIPVVMGSVSTPRHAPALKVLVAKTNPLAGLSLPQLDALFDADRRRGSTAILTWADLGVSGTIASHPIHLYAFPIQSAEMQFLERAALQGSQKFTCCLTLLPTNTAIVAAAAQDPYALALVTEPSAAMRTVPLGSPGTPPTPLAITSGAYPLGRTVYLYARRKPNTPLRPDLAAFMAFIVSAEGQSVAAKTGGYLPLSAQTSAQAHEALQ